MPEPDAAPSAFSSDVLTDAEIASLRLFLSWPMRDIADRFGVDVAKRIVDGLAGQAVYLRDNPKPDHPLAAIAGVDVVRFLAALPGASARVIIPTCQAARRQLRDAEVLKLVRNGAGVADLAMRYGAHVRSTNVWKRKAVRTIQAEVVQLAEARRKTGYVEPPCLLNDAEVRALGLRFAWPLADIADRFGLATVRTLIGKLGGKAVKLPHHARETHPIAACAGIDVLRFIMGLPGAADRREFILSPSTDPLRVLRRAEIRKLVAAGGGVPEIALRFGVDVPTAITWLGHARTTERGAATPAPPDPQPPA